MKIEELRIRNWIKISGQPVLVKEIDKRVNNVEPDELRGIPLTPEILEKCGFEKPQRDDPYGGLLIEIVDTGAKLRLRKGDDCWTWDCHCRIVEVKYIHQLQNLYFALTNTELTITL